MGAALAIRDGRPAERRALEELQLRSSLHAPTYRAQLSAHPEVVRLPPDQLAGGLVRVAEQDGEIAGFAVLLEAAGGACELDGLFVEPVRMGHGVGRALVQDAARLARERGAARIDVVANSDAVGFYERLGFGGDEVAETLFGPARRMWLALDR